MQIGRFSVEFFYFEYSQIASFGFVSLPSEREKKIIFDL